MDNRSKKDQNSITIRSGAVQEILGLVPHWMIRYGNSIILLLIFGMLTFSGFIRYPETIESDIFLTTNNPAYTVYAPINGEFDGLSIVDGATVSKGQLLAVLKDNLGKSHSMNSPIDGSVYFLDFWKEEEAVRKGDVLFKIVPVNQGDSVGKLKIPGQHLTKLTIGQEVSIQLGSGFYFNKEELVGNVNGIVSIPDENGYHAVEVLFTDRLDSSADTLGKHQMDMKDKAYVIIEDLSLLERLFYQLKGIFKPNKI